MFFPNPGIMAAGVGGPAIGQRLFTASGPFVVPEGVYSVCLVVIGRGGGGGRWHSGGGGGLAYVNNLSVVPGETLQVEVTGLLSRVSRAGTALAHASAGQGLGAGAALVGVGYSGGPGVQLFSDEGVASGGGAAGYTSNGGSGTGASILGGGGTGPNGGGGGASGGSNPGSVNGGTYGGGGGRAEVDYFGTGGPGCVRLIWGPGRAFPNTLTEDMS